MKAMKNLAIRNKSVAYAILGQAILDEGTATADGTLEVKYANKENAIFLWDIAQGYGLVHPLKTKKEKNHTMWIVKFKSSERNFIRKVMPFPSNRQNKMIEHQLRRNPDGGKQKYSRGEAKRRLLSSLKKSPTTVRELAYELDLSASTIRQHLYDLRKNGKVKIKGKNKNYPFKNQRSANVWSLN